MSDDRLTLADIARALHPRMDRSTIQRYDNNEDLRAELGKEGKTYPTSSLSLWSALADARNQEPPIVKPETAAVFVRSLREQNPDMLPTVPLSAGLVPRKQDGQEIAIAANRGGEVISLLEKLLASSERREAVQDDALLLLKEAAEQYGISPKALRSLSILEGGRRKVRRTDILRYIASLRSNG